MIYTNAEPFLRRDQWPPSYRVSPDCAMRFGNNLTYTLQVRPVISQEQSNIQLQHSIL